MAVLAEWVKVGSSEIDAVCESCHTKFWYPNRTPPNP
jgi:hypothetical protein